MESIKSITCCVVSSVNGTGDWVVRARLTDGQEWYKGIGYGWTLARAAKMAAAPHAPKVGQPADVLDQDKDDSIFPPKRLWHQLPAGLTCRTV